MLEINNLAKTYKGGKKAVDGISMKVETGDIFGFIGPNGAGKTTTIKAVTGILEFESGEILIDGMSVKKEPIACKKITAYIPDNPDIYEFMTGIAFINFVGDIYQVEKGVREERVKKYADLFEMTANLGDRISSYSHGMRQKIAIIAALIHSPKLLVLDEPFVGLDPNASYILKNIMRDMCAQGCAIFFSTHILEVAEKVCNKVASIREGKLDACGPLEQVKGDESLEQVFLELSGHGE